MTTAIENYRKMVEQPWGKMFYELIFRQLDLPEDQRLKILDFGAGFCITADHYAAFHDVTALEPSEDMCSLRVKNNAYTLIEEGLEYLKTLEDDSFDVVICHNVLEYAEEKEEILQNLVRVLKPAGRLSIVKHNLYGRVMATAVLGDNPASALSLLKNDEAENSMFGSRDVYSNEWLTGLLEAQTEPVDTYALRVFFGLSSNNEIKYTEDWYRNMLELETKAYSIEEYKKVAFFNHLVFRKKMGFPRRRWTGLFAGLFLAAAIAMTGCGADGQPSGNAAESVAEVEAKNAAENASENVTGQTATDIGETDLQTGIETGTEAIEQTENTKEEEGMAATLLYQGHASARIVTGEGKVIYVDPFMGDGYDLPADLILMTHAHYDHIQEDMISSKNEGCKVIKWSDALQNGEYKTFDLGFATVETVEAGYNKNHSVSECVGFILTFSDGVKVYFSGDTSTTPSMPDLAGKNLDYAFLCCDGVYNMDVAEASECAKVIGARHTIPYHMEPVKDKSGFDENTADAFDGPGEIVLRPGDELVLE